MSYADLRPMRDRRHMTLGTPLPHCAIGRTQGLRLVPGCLGSMLLETRGAADLGDVSLSVGFQWGRGRRQRFKVTG